MLRTLFFCEIFFIIIKKLKFELQTLILNLEARYEHFKTATIDILIKIVVP